jgi:hypothetical protein
MNTYSRVLRHIDMKGVKQKHQQKLIEKKLEEDKKRVEEEYIQSVMETKKYDWRKEINEQMTTSDVFFTNLPATGDTNLEFPELNILGGLNYSASNGSVTINGNSETFEDGFVSSFDTSKYDTLVLDVSVNNSLLGVFSFETGQLLIAPSSGTYSISIPKILQKSNANLVFLVPPRTGSVTVSNLRYQRKTPINVFVSLDSPEATSFIRTDPMMSKLSPQERLKKLKDMLEAGDEYVEKMLGSGFPGTGSVPPGDYDPFKQAPAGKAGDTPGVEISQASPAMPSYVRDSIMRQYGKPGYGRFTPEDQMNIIKWQQKLKQADISDQDTQIAQNTQPFSGQKTDVRYDPQMKMFVPRPSDKDAGELIRDILKRANKEIMGGTMVASYEPEGQLISEKKKLKSPEEVLNKIPGYYDGKPAPLGFPETPPPKMVNGMHPDLVNGKKTADRFSKLDPESAKAMPLTGNPHIDKKVVKARKQPK